LKAKPSELSVGDSLVVRNGLNEWRIVKLLSIQINDQPRDSHTCADGDEIGLGFDKTAKQGNIVFKVTAVSSSPLPSVTDARVADPPVIPEVARVSADESIDEGSGSDEEETEAEA
jgi:hypothetical protein